MRLNGTWPLRYASFFLLCMILTFAQIARATDEDKQEQLSVGKAERTFAVHVPKGYDPAQHYPLVLLFPGRQQDAGDMARLSRFNAVADRYGIIAVYPNATRGHWNIGVTPEEAPRENQPRTRGGYGGRRGGIGVGFPGGPMGRRGGGPGGHGSRGGQQRPRQRQNAVPADDVAFVNRMLDKLSSAYSVDTARVYATGLSDGGFMAVSLGCRMADRIAAIAPVGAEMPKTLTCVPSRVLPVLMINGTSDPIVPYKGGSGHAGSYTTLSAVESAGTWAKLNNCGEKSKRSSLPSRTKGGKKTQVDTYSCQPGTEVALYSVKDGGNTWPGGQQYVSEKQVGKTSNDFDAGEVIWKFFQPYHLPAPTAPTAVGGASN